MGRFSKLDFNTEAREPLLGSQDDPWPTLDEQGCLRAGDEYFRTGLYEAALTAYSRALRFNKGLAAAWLGQVRCLICLGEYPEAVTWSNRALERFFNAPDLLACKGQALVLAGNVAKGMEYLDGAVEMRSPSPWVWLARGESLLLTRQPEINAARCLLKALELSPQDWHVELRVGMAYNRVHLWARARGPLLSAARHREGGVNPLVLYHLGLAHEGLGELPAAAGFYQRAQAARRDFTEAQQALSRLQATGVFSKLWRQWRAKK